MKSVPVPLRCLAGVAALLVTAACPAARAQGPGPDAAPRGPGPRGSTKADQGATEEAESFSEGRGLRAFVASAKLGYEGECILRRGHYARALPLLEAAHAEGLKFPFPESLETLQVNRAPTDGGGMRGITERRLGIAHAAAADYAQAEKYLRAALDTEVMYFRDDNNIIIARNHFDLAFALAARGRYDEAEEEYSRFIQIITRDRLLKAGKLPNKAHGYLGLASLALARGRLGDAEREMKLPLLLLKEKRVDAKHPAFAAHARLILGQLRDREGRPDEAAEEYRHALTIARTLGPNHPTAAFALDGLAELDLQAGRLDAAEAGFREALALREPALGAEHRELAYSLDGLARVAMARGRGKDAEPPSGRALAILERCLGIEHPDVAVVAQHRATTLRDLGRDADAAALGRRIPSHPGLSSQGRFLAVPDGLFCEYCANVGG